MRHWDHTFFSSAEISETFLEIQSGYCSKVECVDVDKEECTLFAVDEIKSIDEKKMKIDDKIGSVFVPFGCIYN